MIMLATVWILLIHANTIASLDEPDFLAEQMEFANQDDCETFARQASLSDLLTMKKHRGVSVNFPDGTVPTYTCRDVARP